MLCQQYVSPQTIHFQVLDKSPVSGPGRGPPSCNWWGLFFAETDILTTRGTRRPACLPMDQTQWQQLGPDWPWSPDADNWPECPDRWGTKDFIDLSLLPSLFPLLSPSYPSVFLVPPYLVILSLSLFLSPSQTWPHQGWSHVSSLADAVHPEGTPQILPRLDPCMRLDPETWV